MICGKNSNLFHVMLGDKIDTNSILTAISRHESVGCLNSEQRKFD